MNFLIFMLIFGLGKDFIIYEGELNKKDMVEFFKQVGELNLDLVFVKKKKSKLKVVKEEEFKKFVVEFEEVFEVLIVEEILVSVVLSIILIVSILDDVMFGKECF